jgi:hypothetical protein
MTGPNRLRWIKSLHTTIWAVFVASILGVPIISQLGDLRLAAWLSLAVWAEIFVLVVNGMRCPLTDLAGRYTGDRSDNFDIFLPAWLARYNKLIFGAIFAAAELFLLRQWLIGM